MPGGVVFIRGVNVRGRNLLSMRDLLSTLQKTRPEGVRWIGSVGFSGNILFANPAGVSEEDILAAIENGLRALNRTQSITIRSIEELEESLRASRQALMNLGMKPESQNSTVKVDVDGVWKAGITFLIKKIPDSVRVGYPKDLLKNIKIVGTTERDVHFLWKRKNGTVGVPNNAIENWLKADSTSRLYSTVLRIITRLKMAREITCTLISSHKRKFVPLRKTGLNEPIGPRIFLFFR